MLFSLSTSWFCQISIKTAKRGKQLARPKKIVQHLSNYNLSYSHIFSVVVVVGRLQIKQTGYI